MRYHLDTNVCIRVLDNSAPGLVSRLRATDSGALGVSAVACAELYFGARKSARVDANLALLATFFEPLLVIPFDEACAEAYGRIRAQLQALGQPMGPNDLLIAATALAHEATLVTHDTRAFARVEGLRIEDWESEVGAGS